jgi:hypothetical protein
MLRRSSIILFLVMILPLLRVDAYTVVMKNGKSMTGALISETAEGIVFKDETGLQFSLRKSGLDLEKMAEANKPPAPPVPPPLAPAEPAKAPPQPQTRMTNKPAKVYTQEDIDRLKEVDTSALLEPEVEDTGDPYANAMHSAGVIVGNVYGKCQSLAAQMVSVYDIAAGAGGDGNAAAQKFVAGVTGSTILGVVDADLEKLRSLRGRVAVPEPGDRRLPALDTLDQALKVIPDMRSMLAAPQILSTKDFEGRFNQMSNLINSLSMSLQQVEPVGGTPPEQPAPENEDQTDE